MYSYILDDIQRSLVVSLSPMFTNEDGSTNITCPLHRALKCREEDVPNWVELNSLNTFLILISLSNILSFPHTHTICFVDLCSTEYPLAFFPCRHCWKAYLGNSLQIEHFHVHGKNYQNYWLQDCKGTIYFWPLIIPYKRTQK